MKPLPTHVEQDKAIQEIIDMMDKIKRMQGGTMQSLAAFTLEHGRRYYMNQDSFKGRRGQKSMCFKNSFELATEHPDMTYVEGQCHIGLLNIDHAWCVDREGNVVDPTLKAPEKRKTEVSPCGYFGVPFNRKYLIDRVVKTGYYGLMCYTNKDLILSKHKNFLAVWLKGYRESR